MKLPIAALVLLTATSFAAPAKAVSVLPLASPDAETQQSEIEIQTAIASQDCLICDSAQSTEANTKQSRPGQDAQRQRRQEIRQQQEQQRQRPVEARRQQEQRRQAQEQDRQRQEEARQQQEQEWQEEEWEEEAEREWQEDRDRDRQEEAREEWRDDRDRDSDRDDYFDRDDYYDNDDDYDNDDHDDDYDYGYDDWQSDRYERRNQYDWYQNADDDWDVREREERERQEEAAHRNQEHQAAVWRDWEEQQNVLRWHWDTWQRTYRPALVEATILELTSLDNNWTTVWIEGINTAQEVSFTGNGVQTVYLSPGAYRVRFSPILNDDSWQSGYLVVGRTNRLRITFDQNNESVQVFDDPTAWTPGDRLPGYPDGR